MHELLSSREPVIAYVALGANLGDAIRSVREAAQHIGVLPGTQALTCSSLYRTAPIDSAGPDYINAVLKISTHYPAYTLLRWLQKIEQLAGRERPYRHAPRTLDVDILLYGDAQIQSDVLTVPHPRMTERAFVLLPLQEIAPQRVSTAALLAVADQRIEKIESDYQP
jgi:2-amino-4-hydroxy-6-hydroxymethyldihydropteridine diphosphokinase